MNKYNGSYKYMKIIKGLSLCKSKIWCLKKNNKLLKFLKTTIILVE